jgi:type I restriction-modification system DNA methylase subunit
MSLFQKSVLNKYYNELSISEIQDSYKSFQSVFNNPAKQQNILNAKEEQYQEGFLRELFVNILGYRLYPDENHNIITEQKNEGNSKKVDGAILNGLIVTAVIELKSTKTIDLASIESQAFGYKNNQQECEYVITSNFKKLRFYIDNAVEFLEFDLFNLNFEDFKLMWVCLSSNYLLKNIPSQIKEASNHQEEKITKQLYSDYAKFRNELFNDICIKNTDYDKLFLFKKTQKLLDRFLFLFFAEDRGLVAPNWTRKILQDWTDLKDKYDNYIPLYTRFRKNFDYLNTGYHGKDGEIFAYNGGLFAPDEVLDSLTIDDDLLYKGSLKLSNYDFDSEVDVNILGHIFEHSLNEIDEIQASLEEVKVDKVTKRKKDGVFYTPKYITKYIVENTIGTLCKDEKDRLKIVEEDFEFIDAKAGKKLTDKRKELNQKIDDYRNWLLQLKIVDPACGSGAFLNQALDFLILEHSKLDELRARLLGGSIILSDVETSILENNLYGVDINEEAVEIAKLSLWLRTARKGRKLNSLNNNLKCGNSLIDDIEVAGDKAFNWKLEFKEVFEKGGFDVVIGNPPYVRQELLGDFKDYFSQKYKVFNFSSDLFAYFYELAFNVLKQNGIFSFISNTFDKTTAGVNLRAYLKEKVSFLKFIDFTDLQIFDGATTYPVILIAENEIPKKELQFLFTKIPATANPKGLDIDLFAKDVINQENLRSDNWNFKSSLEGILLDKITKHPKIREKFGKCYYGVKTSLNEAFITEKEIRYSDFVKPIYEGKDLKKWVSPTTRKKLILFKSKWTKEKYGNEITEEEAKVYLERDFPEIFSDLMHFEEQAKKRYDKGDFWWELRNCAYYDLFDKPKISFPNLQNKNKFSFDDDGIFINAPAVFISTDDKALLSILNSKLVWYFLNSICVVRSGGYIEVKPQYFEQIPIPEITEELNNQLVKKSELNIQQTKSLDMLNGLFQNRKFEKWNELTSKEFFKELEKQKVKLSLREQSEWLQYFEEQKNKALAIKSQISQTDKEIDQMVYALYELTEEEIKIVEN